MDRRMCFPCKLMNFQWSIRRETAATNQCNGVLRLRPNVILMPRHLHHAPNETKRIRNAISIWTLPNCDFSSIPLHAKWRCHVARCQHDASKNKLSTVVHCAPLQTWDRRWCSLFTISSILQFHSMQICTDRQSTADIHKRSRSVSENHIPFFVAIYRNPSLSRVFFFFYFSFVCRNCRMVSYNLFAAALLASTACVFSGLEQYTSANLHFHFLLFFLSSWRRTCNWRVKIAIWISFSIESWEFISVRHCFFCIYSVDESERDRKNKTNKHIRSAIAEIVSFSVLSNQVHKIEKR